MPYERKCPSCNRPQIYAYYSAFYKAIKWNKVCKACCQTGKKFSIGHREKMRIMKVGRKHTSQHILHNSVAQSQRFLKVEERRKISSAVKIALHRPDIRKKHIKALAETRWLGKSFDRGQVKMLEKWNGVGFRFIPNYQVHTDDFLGYVDGYDPDHSVVIEYDTEYHRKPSQMKRDSVRQQKIIEILKPKKFWRYNTTHQSWRNVIG